MKKPMTVFYAIQVSNYTMVNGKPKWLLRNDACTNIAVGIMSTILENYSNYKFIVKLPSADHCKDVDNLNELFEKKYLDRIEFYTEDIPISPVTSRFNFDFNYHSKNKSVFGVVDVMINDENTLTKNWRVLFKSMGLEIPIISTNYFLDSPIAGKVSKDIRYYERQMESFIASDVAAFQCEAGRIEAMEAFDYTFKNRDSLAKQSVWGVGAHYAEISKYHTSERFETPTIYFGNRISDTANRYTNYDTFAKAIGLLSTLTKTPFRAVMLNPTRKVTEDQLNLIEDLSNNNVEVMSNDEAFTREDYLNFINRAHISCNLFVTEVHGGVTHCEAMMSNNMVIMPKVNNYLHKMRNAGHDDYPLFIQLNTKDKTKPDALDLAYSIKYALERIGTSEGTELTKICHDVGYEYESYERACDRIVSDIEYAKSLYIKELETVK